MPRPSPARSTARALPLAFSRFAVCLLTVCAFAALAFAAADPPLYTDVGAELIGVQDGNLAWGDYDADGDLDLLITGNTGSARVARLYRNDGGVFVEESNALLPGVSLSSAAFVDYDGDGKLDIFLSGSALSVGTITRLYRNLGGGHFAWDTAAQLPGVSGGSAAWADYDGDGDPDLLLTGTASDNTRISRLYRNDGDGLFSEETLALLPGVANGSVAWADYDGDGDPDFILTGNTVGSSRISRLYRNDGGGLFTWESNAAFLGVANSSVAWGDYDGDGAPDLLLTGNTGSGLISWVYRNLGGGFFARESSAVLPGAYFSSVAWGDYDGDGAPDILLSGESDVGKIARLYRNQGAGVFVHDASVVLPGVARSHVVFADFDNDGDLDLALMGWTGLARIAQVWENGLRQPTRNQPPLADAGGPYEVECAGAGTWIQLDGSASADPDGDELLYQWFCDLPGAAFDNASLVAPLLTFNASAPTSFEVKLVVMDADYIAVATSTVTALDRVAPSIHVPDDIIQAPTSPQGNVVYYTPLVSDVCDPYPVWSCVPPSGSLFPPGTSTTVVVTATDASGNSAQASFKVVILSLRQVAEELQRIVAGLGSSGSLNKGETNSLLTQLRNIMDSLGRAKGNAGVGQLTGFINKVEEFIANGKLTPEEGQPLLELARSLLASLGG